MPVAVAMPVAVMMRVAMVMKWTMFVVMLVAMVVVSHRYFVTPWNSEINSRNSRGKASAVSSMQ